jgi:hypothetical protein
MDMDQHSSHREGLWACTAGASFLALPTSQRQHPFRGPPQYFPKYQPVILSQQHWFQYIFDTPTCNFHVRFISPRLSFAFLPYHVFLLWVNIAHSVHIFFQILSLIFAFYLLAYFFPFIFVLLLLILLHLISYSFLPTRNRFLIFSPPRLFPSNFYIYITPWPLVRERTIPTERPTLVDEI